jgi:hypothetical protein
MKNLFVIALLFVVLGLKSQVNIKEPEFPGTIVFVNDSIGEGVRLEIQNCYTKASGSASLYVTGVGKAKAFSVVNGAKSNVRIGAKSNLKFLVTVKDNSVNPTSIINIFPLTPKKDKRIIEVGTSTTFGGVEQSTIPFLQFTASKYGNSSYLVELSNVAPGEYAITLPDSRDLFNMFGID